MSVKTEVIGHYTVKYNHMGARVFYTHSGEMADGTIFPNKDAAIAWIEQFSETSSEKRRAPHIATAEEYYHAFKSIKVTDNQIIMLRAHVKAEGRRLKPIQLAASADKKSSAFANRWYGGVGRLISEFLSLDIEAENDMAWTQAIAVYDVDAWVMHPEVAEALTRLNIC